MFTAVLGGQNSMLGNILLAAGPQGAPVTGSITLFCAASWASLTGTTTLFCPANWTVATGTMNLYSQGGSPPSGNGGLSMFCPGSSGAPYVMGGLPFYCSGAHGPSGYLNMFAQGPASGLSMGFLNLYASGDYPRSQAGLTLYTRGSGWDTASTGLSLYAKGPGVGSGGGGMNLFLQRVPADWLPMFCQGPGTPVSTGMPMKSVGHSPVASGLPLVMPATKDTTTTGLDLYSHGF